MKQKLVSILLVLCMVVALVPAIALTSAAANTVEDTNKDGTLPEGVTTIEDGTSETLAGSGTSDDPYKIANLKDWNYFAKTAGPAASADTYFVLTGNIYMNKYLGNWDESNLPTDYNDNSGATLNGVKPTRYTAVSKFAGHFDGANFAIYNPFTRSSNGAGLFKDVTGTIENLNVYGGYLVGTANGNYSLLVASLNGGTVRNCFVSTDAYLKGGNYSWRCGGIAAATGSSGATIEGCTYTGTIVADGGTDGMVGGIAGRIEGALTIQNTIHTGAIVAGVSRVGGIIGMVNASGKLVQLDKCANYGNLKTTTTTNHGIAGVVGINNTGNVQLSQCANYATVSSENKCYAAGILGGQMKDGDVISQCANYGDIQGSGASGIVAYTFGDLISNCFVEGELNNVDTSQSSAILVGWVKDTTTIENCVGVGSANLYSAASGKLTDTNCKKYAIGSAQLTDGTAVSILNTGLDTPVWVAGETAPVLKWIADMNATPAPEITIDGASLTIGGNVTMNLFVKKTTVAAAGVTLGKISIVDNDNTPYEVTDDSGDYYVFTIKGLRASEFGKNKIYHVQYTTADAPGTPIDCTATKEYSPLQYAINMYNADDKTETVTDLDKLLLSIVNYADAAAKTTDASTAFKAVHTKADFSTLPKFADIIKEDKGVYTYDELKTGKNLPGISANLTETIALTLTFDGSDLYQTGNDNMMMIGNVEIPGEVNALNVVFSELYATDLYNTITFTFVETYESGLLVTATTSLVQFLKSYQGQGPTEEALAAATAQYLYVARLFCLNNQPNA